MTNKETFISIYTNNIKRQGSMELLKYLENSDFFVAPSSTRFHGACKEGLLNHSLKVYEIFRNEVIEYNKNVSGLDKLDDKTEETIAICGLLHDLCKCNFYKESTKNVKNEKLVLGKKFLVIPLTKNSHSVTVKSLCFSL